jgi:hypothetical protein
MVPEALRAFLLPRYHSLPVSGHKGRHKTTYTIQLRYYWPRIDRDITRWIRTCPTCVKRKTPRALNSRPPPSISEAKRPWEHISIDLVMAGASNDSIAPAKYILTILCTRFVITIPISSKSAHYVSETLFNYAFGSHGRPLSIRSDEGKEFVNAGLLALYRRWNIDPITTGGWRP